MGKERILERENEKFWKRRRTAKRARKVGGGGPFRKSHWGGRAWGGVGGYKRERDVHHLRGGKGVASLLGEGPLSHQAFSREGKRKKPVVFWGGEKGTCSAICREKIIPGESKNLSRRKENTPFPKEGGESQVRGGKISSPGKGWVKVPFVGLGEGGGKTVSQGAASRKKR